MYIVVTHDLIRKICFIGFSKLYPSHFVDNHLLIAPIKLDETVSPFQSPFRENVYLIFNNGQRRSYQIFKVLDFMHVLNFVKTADKQPINL